MQKLPSLVGQTYGRLTVLSEAPASTSGQRCWLVRCECGKELVVRQANIRNGNTTSCGCFLRERQAQSNYKHGLTGRPEHYAWVAMHQRCYSPHHQSFKHYGARGITVCARWHDPAAFIADMGPRPSPEHSIDRIDNDLGYSPENCRWTTMRQQVRNSRHAHNLTINGETACLMDWLQRAGISSSTFYRRRKKGASPEEALFKP